MDWKSFVNDKSLYFYWYGFYNSKTKKREFTECEFQQETKGRNERNVVLIKCKSNE